MTVVSVDFTYTRSREPATRLLTVAAVEEGGSFQRFCTSYCYVCHPSHPRQAAFGSSFAFYSTSAVLLSSKLCPATRSGMSSSSSSSFPASSPFSFCSDEYDSASLRRDARESGPSWLRIPGTSSVSSLSSPCPYRANVLDGRAPWTEQMLALGACVRCCFLRAWPGVRSACGYVADPEPFADRWGVDSLRLRNRPL